MKSTLKLLVMEPLQFVVTVLLRNSIRENCCTASCRLTLSVDTCGEIVGCALIQDDSLARGPKLLSIKHYVIEIMT
jgi:hypothetical protein